MVLNVILAILVLSIIIIIHEFGHFIIAKANGITVVEFAIGFGPKLIHLKKGETEYCLKLLPFGGACIMLGEDFLDADDEDDDDDDSETDNENSIMSDTKTTASDEKISAGQLMKNKQLEKAVENGYDMSKSFANKSVWARIAVIAAGPIFNFILAFVCAIVIIGSIGFDPCRIDKVYDNSPASEAGLKEGDIIKSVNGEKMTFAREYSFYTSYYGDKDMNITYERDGEKYTTTVKPEYIKQTKYQMGIMITQDCVVSSVSDNSPAEEAGFKANDKVVSINGISMSNNSQITETTAANGDKEMIVEVNRQGESVFLKVTPKLTETESYYTGLACYGGRTKVSPINTVGYAIQETGYNVKLVLKTLGMMFTGKVSVNNLMGPVGTVSTMSNVVEESKADGAFYVFLNLMNLCGLISANLGVMNLLPLPALDGGRLVFLIIEAIRGKAVKKEHEGMVHFVGMVLLMILMVYVMFKDIKGLF